MKNVDSAWHSHAETMHACRERRIGRPREISVFCVACRLQFCLSHECHVNTATFPHPCASHRPRLHSSGAFQCPLRITKYVLPRQSKTEQELSPCPQHERNTLLWAPASVHSGPGGEGRGRTRSAAVTRSPSSYEGCLQYQAEFMRIAHHSGARTRDPRG